MQLEEQSGDVQEEEGDERVVVNGREMRDVNAATYW